MGNNTNLDREGSSKGALDVKNRFFDASEIAKALNILKPGNELFEIRIVKGKKIFSGYFYQLDPLISELNKMSLEGSNVYITLHELHPGCEARIQFNKLVDTSTGKIPTTSDGDVIGYKYIPIDLDPVRPAGISSSNEELEYAADMRKMIEAYMKSQGFRGYIRAFSGNGYHLLYPYTAENVKDGSAEAEVKNYLKSLDEMFGDDFCHVDTGNFNPSRVFKLYGTLAQKGRNTESRPHRMSHILEVVNDGEEDAV